MNNFFSRISALLPKLKYNALMGLLFAFLVVLPDYLFEAFLPNITYLTDCVFLAVMFVFGFFLSLSGVWVYAVCCLLFMFMQLIQLGHIAYFARPINPLDIGKVFDELDDIYSAGISDWDDFWFVPLAAALPFLILLFMEFKWRKKLYFSFIGILAVIIFLGVKPERATRRGLHSFLPPETRYSIHNSINSFSFYLVHGADSKNIHDIVPQDFYLPYKVEKLPESSQLVVLIMGESTNADKMHLFNPNARQTTPQLDKMKDNAGFVYSTAISGAVSTHSSLPIFFNMMKEPGNIQKLEIEDTNLFRMAKENGFKTYFYSAYDMKQTNLIGVRYIDEIVTSEHNPRKFKRKKEDLLLKMFKKLDLKNGKNFVVLNFKSVHSPYEENYEHHQKFDVFKPKDGSRFEEENAAYDNAILYIDSVLGQLLAEFKRLNIAKSQFIFTSDHGEMLGLPDGRYGHNQLVMEDMRVPFFLYSLGGKTPVLPKGVISHYEISELAAQYLGYKVTNPNYNNNVFFVHGNNLFEEYQFVEYQRINGKLQEVLKDEVEDFIREKIKERVE